MDLHAGDTLEVGGHQVGSYRPMPVGYVGSLHDRALFHAEVFPTITAPVFHGRVRGGPGVWIVAERALPAVLPNPAFKPFLGCFVVREFLRVPSW